MDYSILEEEEEKEVFPLLCFFSWLLIFLLVYFWSRWWGRDRKKDKVLMVIKMQQGTFFSLFLYSSSYHHPTPSLPAAPVDPSAPAATTIRSSLKSLTTTTTTTAYSSPLTCSECESAIGGSVRGREGGWGNTPASSKGFSRVIFSPLLSVWMLDLETEEMLKTWRTDGQTPGGHVVEIWGQSVFVLFFLIGFVMEVEIIKKFSIFIVSLMGFLFLFLFYCAILLCNNRTRVNLKSLLVSGRRFEAEKRQPTQQMTAKKFEKPTTKEKYWLKKKKNMMLCFLVFVCFFNRAFSLITESGFIWEQKFKIKSIKKLFFVRSHGFKVTASSLPMCSRSDMASGQPTVCYSRTLRQTCDWLGSELEEGVAVDRCFDMCLCIWRITRKKFSN